MTRKKIRDLIGPGLIDADTRVVLTNAIYMKAAWTTPFHTAATRENALFHGSRLALAWGAVLADVSGDGEADLAEML